MEYSGGMNVWAGLYPSQAQQHPLYGIKGWAIVCLIFLVVKLVGQLTGPGSVYQIILALTGRVSDFPWALTILALALMVWNGYIIYLFCKKEERFQTALLFFLIAEVIAFVIYAVVSNNYLSRVSTQSYLNEAFIGGTSSFVLHLLGNIGLYVYVIKSKRIQVTLCHRVRPNDHSYTQQDSSTSMEKISMNWKHPAVRIIITVVVLIVLYYVVSPYQNCMRDRKNNSDSQSRNAWLCAKYTSW